MRTPGGAGQSSRCSGQVLDSSLRWPRDLNLELQGESGFWRGNLVLKVCSRGGEAVEQQEMASHELTEVPGVFSE